MRIKDNLSSPKLKTVDIKFCTACEEELEDFSLSSMVNNLDVIQKNHENCKKIGKFNGEMCSRLFIAKKVSDFFPEEE
jgi:hypothetical protein